MLPLSMLSGVAGNCERLWQGRLSENCQIPQTDGVILSQGILPFSLGDGHQASAAPQCTTLHVCQSQLWLSLGALAVGPSL